MNPTQRILVSVLAGAGLAYVWKAHRVVAFVVGTFATSQALALFVPPEAGV